MTHRRLRSMAASLAAVAALLLTAVPVGAWQETTKTGNTGFYEGPDEQALKGAICRYDSDFDLYRFVIKPPEAHSYYNKNQKIGYRYIIQRDTMPYDGDYTTYYRSPFVYDTANQLLPTEFGNRTYTLPSNANVNANWRVVVVLKWVKPGTVAKPDGRVIGYIEAYKAVKGTNSHPFDGYCNGSY